MTDDEIMDEVINDLMECQYKIRDLEYKYAGLLKHLGLIEGGLVDDLVNPPYMRVAEKLNG